MKGALMSQHEIAGLERRGWEALSSAGPAAASFYERHLDQAVIMLLPGGLVLDDRAAIIEAMSATPWSSFQLQDLWVFQPAPDTGIVVYGVVARRGDARPYSALVSSHYARRGDGWKMNFPQQTPR
jgi:Domain of unknown function (DUF4440)